MKGWGIEEEHGGRDRWRQQAEELVSMHMFAGMGQWQYEHRVDGLWGEAMPHNLDLMLFDVQH